jgi:hypothetical protein
MTMKIVGRTVLALCPVAGLLVASVSDGRSLTAYMDVNGGLPDGSQFWDCTGTGTDGLVTAVAHGFNSSGGEVCVTPGVTKTGSGSSNQTSCPTSTAAYHKAQIWTAAHTHEQWGAISKTGKTPGWVSTGSPNYYNTSYAFYPGRVVPPYNGPCMDGIVPRAWSWGTESPP